MNKLFLWLMVSAFLCPSLLSADDASSAPQTTSTGNTTDVPIPVPDGTKNAASFLGINLAGIAAWGSEYPFSDVFHGQSRGWVSQQKGLPYGQGPTLALDEHGWVKKLDPDCSVYAPVLVNAPAAHTPAGPWTLLYEGEGDISISPPATTTILSNESGKITFKLTGDTHDFTVVISSTNPANYIRNIHIPWPGTETTWKDQPFRSDFLDHWKGFNTIRFMDWGRTNGSTIAEWADRAKPDDVTYTYKGVPLEVMIDLCNRTLSNPWICIPHLASDDYVHHVAQYIKDNLKPGLKVHIEYSNEVWNDQFAQAKYAAQKATEQKIPPLERPWEGRAKYYVQRSLEIFKIFEQEFGGTDRLVRVIAWQACAPSYWTEGLVLNQPGVDGHVDALSIAPYITFLVKPGLATLNADQVATWSLDQVFDRLEKVSLPDSIKWIQAQKAFADKHGIKLMAYESGQHLVGVGGGENNAALTKLFEEANRDPRMGAIYKEYLDAWKSAGGDTMCLFSSVGNWSKWGSWGLMEYHDQTTADAPKYRAVIDWNSQNHR